MSIEGLTSIEYKQGADGRWIGPDQALIHDPAGAAFLELQLALFGHTKQQDKAKAQLSNIDSAPSPQL